MKLRNKKTGEIIEFACVHICNYHTNDKECEEKDVECRSLEKLLENREDYKPTEPLIKDEKIRKAVRAWSNSVGCMERIIYESIFNRFVTGYGSDISFDVPLGFGDGHYTIAELCGEEEE